MPDNRDRTDQLHQLLFCRCDAEFVLPEEYESVKVGDVVKKKIDEILEGEGLTPKKMLIYLLCCAMGLSIGFLIVYFMSK